MIKYLTDVKAGEKETDSSSDSKSANSNQNLIPEQCSGAISPCNLFDRIRYSGKLKHSGCSDRYRLR
ncbi:hypothetical protein LFE_2269 [Leptospirillum ferrooxidans C2-3]|uniref:Uncharacterized protein n=1 Tax=Leptospirillum ferrooxidans (strain C2-3) TaxID=1162668 RepID=I0IRP2_LEPFC|nr:hypothetical protein LFE_2269 [Leptospirillum ferrooxidans C2-3]